MPPNPQNDKKLRKRQARSENDFHSNGLLSITNRQKHSPQKDKSTKPTTE
jgi:hypothetical protein